MKFLDIAFWGYMVKAVANVWMFILFYHWWRKGRAKTEKYNQAVEMHNMEYETKMEKREFHVGVVFHLMMWVALGAFIESAASLFARYLRFDCHTYYMPFMDSFLWHIRTIPLDVFLIVLCIVMTKRYLTAVRKF